MRSASDPLSGLPLLLLLLVLAPAAAMLLTAPLGWGLGFLPWGAEGPPPPTRVFSRVTVLGFVLGVILLRARLGYTAWLGEMLRWDRDSRRQLATGLVYSLLPLLALAVALVVLGAWRWLPQPPLKMLSRLPGYVASALLIGLLEETLFRGIILTLLVRAWGAWRGLFFSALFFAFLHPLGTPIEAPADYSFLAGASALASLLALFQEPLVQRQLVGYFLGGLILARATLLSDRLWAALGLHVGWVFFIRADGLFLKRSHDWDALYFGHNRLVDGILIWLFLLLVYILVDRTLRRSSTRREP